MMSSSLVQDERYMQAPRRPRIFIVQPQRLFLEALVQTLGEAFDVAGTTPTLDAVEGADADIILIDADAVSVSHDLLLERCRNIAKTTLLCLLSMQALPIAVLCDLTVVHVIPKDLKTAELTQRLFALATATKPQRPTAIV